METDIDTIVRAVIATLKDIETPKTPTLFDSTITVSHQTPHKPKQVKAKNQKAKPKDRKRTHWTEDEIAAVRLGVKLEKTHSDIAVFINRSTEAVRKKAKV
jgi:hypothetical protein